MDQFYSVRILARLFLFTVTGNIFFNAATAQPVITSFAPSIGPVGTTVTITGTGFHTTAANNIVYFGAVKANVSAATATSLTVQVPYGATHELITVTTGNLTGYSSKSFHVTFSGGTITTSAFNTRTDFTVAYWDFMLVKDFDGDGKSDVISCDQFGTLGIFRNTTSTATVTFAAKTTLSCIAMRDITAADMDGDGLQDIIISGGGGSPENVISIHRNTSTPGNISFATAVNFTLNESVEEMTVADIDLDGRPDILGATYSGSFADRISILRNTTSGSTLSFAAQYNLPTLPVNGFVEGFVVSDIDGDAKADIALIHKTTPTIVVLYKNSSTPGNPSFAVYSSFNLPPLSFGDFITSGDLDGDNKAELIITNSSNTNKIYVLRNTSTTGSLTFASAVEVDPGDPIWDAFRITVADMNGDGKADLVYSDPGTDIVGLIQNNSTTGNISFGTGLAIANAPNPIPINAADLNADGKPEIIVSGVDAGASSTVMLTVYTNGIALLPVNLLAFTGTQTDNGVSLKWSAVSDKSNEVFMIEHSINGNEFAAIGSVKASAGNIRTDYSFLHDQPVAGWNYYRLKIVDADGKFIYSHIIRINMGGREVTLQLYPNPSNNISIVEHPIAEKASIILSGMSGKVVRRMNVSGNAGQTIISTKDMIPGSYIVTWISEGRSLSALLKVN